MLQFISNCVKQIQFRYFFKLFYIMVQFIEEKNVSIIGFMIRWICRLDVNNMWNELLKLYNPKPQIAYSNKFLELANAKMWFIDSSISLTFVWNLYLKRIYCVDFSYNSRSKMWIENIKHRHFRYFCGFQIVNTTLTTPSVFVFNRVHFSAKLSWLFLFIPSLIRVMGCSSN